MTKNPFGSRDPTLDADRLPETDPGFKAEGEPYPPSGLTDTWYCTSEVHTSSSPTTQGMASVRPFKSFKAFCNASRSGLPCVKAKTGSLATFREEVCFHRSLGYKGGEQSQTGQQ